MNHYRSPKTQPPSSRLPTLRSPTRLGVPSKLIRFPNALRRAGCPRSSPRRYAAIVGYADGNGLEYQYDYHHITSMTSPCR
ncbi:MAG: hypothetical protein LBQ66_11435 [Planctomycetaceae bacterium]|nr:hypothetical protein [Planctomycetaceae bacterium]